MSNYRDIVAAEGVVIEQLISSTYYIIGCAETISFHYENEIIYKTDVNAGGHRKKRARLSDSNIRITGVTKLSNAGNVLGVFESLNGAYIRTENTYRITYTAQDASTETITCTGIISEIDINGSATDFSDFDIKIECSDGIEFDAPVDPGSGSQVAHETFTISGGNYYISDASLVNVADIIEVDLEGTQYDETTGTPSGREFKYVSATGRIEFDPLVVMNGQKVFVIWLY